jgi:hypothetical protein
MQLISPALDRAVSLLGASTAPWDNRARAELLRAAFDDLEAFVDLGDRVHELDLEEVLRPQADRLDAEMTLAAERGEAETFHILNEQVQALTRIVRRLGRLHEAGRLIGPDYR